MELPAYDVNAKTKMTVAPHSVVVTLRQTMRVVTHAFDAARALQTVALGTGSAQTIQASDLVTVLEISQ